MARRKLFKVRGMPKIKSVHKVSWKPEGLGFMPKRTRRRKKSLKSIIGSV